MSAKATFWAWEQQHIGSSAKLVLLCLADHHNADSGRCDPSEKFIADKTGLNVKTVNSAIKKLADLDLLSYEYRRGTSNNYTLHLHQNRVHPKTGTPKIGDTQFREGVHPKLGVEVHPKLGDKPTSESKKNLIINKPPPGINLEAWNEWVEFRKSKRKPVSEQAAKLNWKMLANYDLPAQREIIENSIRKDYQGLFEPTGGYHAKSQRTDASSGCDLGADDEFFAEVERVINRAT